MSDKFSELKKAYKLVFALPRNEFLVATAFVLVIVCLIVAIRVGAVQSFLGAVITAAVPVLVSKIVDTRIITWRRAGGLYIVFLLLSLASLIVSGDAYPGTLSGALLGYLFLAVSSSPLKAILPLLSYIAVLGITATSIAAKLSALALGYMLATLGSLALIDHRVKKVSGASGLTLLKGFLRYILSGEKCPLEEAFARLSTERKLNLHVFSFEDPRNKPLGRVVVSEIHPGPFRDLGSSSLPSKVIAAHGNLPVVFLKAPSTHAENLAFSIDVSRLMGELMQLKGGSDYSEYARIGVAVKGRFRVITLSFSHTTLAFADPLVPMEDLPHNLCTVLAPQKVIVVDTHSMIAEGYGVLDRPAISLPEYSEILSAVTEALENPLEEGALRAAFERIDYSDGVSVASGGISCAVVAVGNVKVGVVSIDSNNVRADFKPVLLKALEKYVDVPIVASTDTHLLTGRITGVEYYPAGSILPDQLLTRCLQCVESAVERLEEARVKYSPLPFRSLYLRGDLMEEISRVTRGNVVIGIILVALAIAASALALL